MVLLHAMPHQFCLMFLESKVLSANPTENFPGQSGKEENGSQCRVLPSKCCTFSLMYQATCHKFIKKKKNQSSCKKEAFLISQILIQNGESA